MNNRLSDVFRLLKSTAAKTNKARKNNAWYKYVTRSVIILLFLGIAGIAIINIIAILTHIGMIIVIVISLTLFI